MKSSPADEPEMLETQAPTPSGQPKKDFFLKHLLHQFNKINDAMQGRTWWRLETALVVGAIFCGLISGILSHANSNATKRQLEELFATNEIIVAAEDLKENEIIDQGKLKVATGLSRNISENSITPQKVNIILGKRLAIDLKAGDPLLLTSVHGAKEIRNMADKIPPGKRLFTLTVADVAASQGFIRPNDHVDILGHVKLPERGLTTFTILQDVTLVSVGQATVLQDQMNAAGSTVSFFAEAKDVEMLSFAQQRGTFSLSLRNAKDIGKSEQGKGIDVNEFLDYEGIHEVSGGGSLTITEKGKTLSAPQSPKAVR